MGSFFDVHHVLLTPTLGAMPAGLGTDEPDAELAPRELFDSWSQLESFLPVFNAAGQPAGGLPLHQGGTGLPIGMQLVGPFGDQATLLRLAAQLEQALPWAGRVPPRGCRVPLSTRIGGQRASGGAPIQGRGSEVERELAGGLRAADQRAPSAGASSGSGRTRRHRDQARLAGVADAGAARPADRDVACLGQLEQAGEGGVPVDGEVAAGEGDAGPLPERRRADGRPRGRPAMPGVRAGAAPKSSV